jgi:DNA-directed RNA polymerase specialized sigma subunit
LLAIKPQERPETDMQALMETPPGGHEVMSKQALQVVREAVADCMDMLTEQDRYVLDALNAERIPLRELAERLGLSITQTWRLKEDALANLKQFLVNHQVIKDYLGLDDE